MSISRVVSCIITVILLLVAGVAGDDPQATSEPAPALASATAATSSETGDPQPVGDVNATGLVVPTNQTSNLLPNFVLEVKTANSGLVLSTELSAMTPLNGTVSSTNGLSDLCSGELTLMNSTTNLNYNMIPLLSCDDADLVAGYLVNVEGSNSPCAVLYSLHSQGCEFDSTSTFETQLGTVFSITSAQYSASIISQINRTMGPITASISSKASENNPGNGSPLTSKSTGSTVAMAVLYSITGVVAATFLFIIVSGAIRVHKHPERYGLVSNTTSYDSNHGPGGEGFGSMQYSRRAKGLARAVLDSIPIVQFKVGNDASGRTTASPKEESIGIDDNIGRQYAVDGEKQGRDSYSLDNLKAGNESMVETTNESIDELYTPGKNVVEPPTQTESLPTGPEGAVGTSAVADVSREPVAAKAVPPVSQSVSEVGTETPAASHVNGTQPMETLVGGLNSDEPDCPICFESFKDGDILRILPCKHRFHALCVDPWLLNSSALCPLCRVDLSLEENEQVSNDPPNGLNASSHHEVEISLFNRLLDIWNAQLLPREARRVALARFHEEAELRRQLRSRQGNNFEEQNSRRWTNFVNSRRRLFQLRRNRRGASDHEEPAHDNDNNPTSDPSAPPPSSQT
ncbi:hypothetical protein AWJ20_2278 [Sugiyamaella lignohabitans]|uniref:RING-type domain-containing protein n=1 Tax=Sugiyamaella lignohabitans TaxID=796027 RepID=A0A167F0J1_9ASCO|nr:uncharacterized protein AWJ20_2278 [Sugiyamaella lignohabitans]ANB14673.1 hypothetical protein AWJ20_2278 [Sugiyamaella lignohabitans]